MDGDAMRRNGGGQPGFQDAYELAVAALADRLAGQPGVSGLTVADDLPGFSHRQWQVDVEDAPSLARAQPGERAQIAAVDRRFFEVMGVRLAAGRGFGAGDFESDTRAVIVNESFVDLFLGGVSAIGRRLRYRTSASAPFFGPPEDGPEPEWLEIVGVIADMKMSGDPTSPHNAGVYHPLRRGALYPVRLALHVPGGPGDFVPRLLQATRDVAPALRLARPVPLDAANAADELALRSWLLILAVIGGFAVLLTNAGIYAIISFTVARRTREIGVRVALGADRVGIVVAVLARMARSVAIGVGGGGVVGLALAFALAEGTAEVTPGMWALAAVYLIGMIGVCMTACVAPTRRALAIRPNEALSAEG